MGLRALIVLSYCDPITFKLKFIIHTLGRREARLNVAVHNHVMYDCEGGGRSLQCYITHNCYSTVNFYFYMF